MRRWNKILLHCLTSSTSFIASMHLPAWYHFDMLHSSSVFSNRALVESLDFFKLFLWVLCFKYLLKNIELLTQIAAFCLTYPLAARKITIMRLTLFRSVCWLLRTISNLPLDSCEGLYNLQLDLNFCSRNLSNSLMDPIIGSINEQTFQSCIKTPIFQLYYFPLSKSHERFLNTIFSKGWCPPAWVRAIWLVAQRKEP